MLHYGGTFQWGEMRGHYRHQAQHQLYTGRSITKKTKNKLALSLGFPIYQYKQPGDSTIKSISE